MDFKDLIKKRHSARNYNSKKINRELIKKIIEAGRLAPSACNKQPWKFLVIDESDLLEEIQKVYDRQWFHEAPALIIAYANRKEAWVREYDEKNHSDIDVAIAVDHMTLMAAELGVDSCWICHFNPAILQEVIPTEPYWQPVAIISLGYDDSTKISMKKRKVTEDIVCYNSWK